MSWWMTAILIIVAALAIWFGICLRQAYDENKAKATAEEDERSRPRWKGASAEWKSQVRGLEQKYAAKPSKQEDVSLTIETSEKNSATHQSLLADVVRQEKGAEPSAEGALVFVYTDSRGQVTSRELTAWRYDGTYVKGYCRDQDAIRTFRRDRIGPFIAGEELLDRRLERKSFGSSNDSLFSDAGMEVLFTGFPADDRLELENAARDAGITVRTTVTKNLTYLCAGPRAGATKLRQAGERGATVLDEEQFRHMIETGELLGY